MDMSCSKADSSPLLHLLSSRVISPLVSFMSVCCFLPPFPVQFREPDSPWQKRKTLSSLRRKAVSLLREPLSRFATGRHDIVRRKQGAFHAAVQNCWSSLSEFIAV